jgi:NAD(P) transhydrogenase
MAHFDMAVIGSGPAGQRGAIQAAKLGKRVLLVERAERIGGVSAHTGTIPSKTLREAILYLTGHQQRGIYGPDYCLKSDITIADLRERLAVTINHEVAVMLDQLTRNGVTIVHGTAAFLDPRRIAVRATNGDRLEYTADGFLIATGARPHRPRAVPFDDEVIVDSDSLLRIDRLPRRAIVVGAGVIGLEYATMCRVLGMAVTLVHERARILEFADREVVEEFVRYLRDSGIDLRLGATVTNVVRTERGVELALDDGSRLSSDMLLYTGGRQGCVDDLALENAGLAADQRGRLKVNTHFQTAVPHIYAAGDVIGFPSLAAVSFEQGRAAACHACGGPALSNSPNFPYGIYTVPEISMIGRTEQELTGQGVAYVVGRARLRETARGQIMGLQRGLLKLLFARDDRRLLGAHILGEGATELVHTGQAVLELGGTLDYFVEHAFNYPTLTEGYKIAALDAWNRLRA